MSSADQKDDVASAGSSRFGKRLGRFIAIVLVVLAAVVAVATFSGREDSVLQPTTSTNQF